MVHLSHQIFLLTGLRCHKIKIPDIDNSGFLHRFVSFLFTPHNFIKDSLKLFS